MIRTCNPGRDQIMKGPREEVHILKKEAGYETGVKR